MMDKIAIYTCITGGYDSLSQPLADDPQFDFICYVAKGEKRLEADGVWQIRELPVELGNARMNSRYAKMHPHELLGNYTYSLWMDGNIIIDGNTVYEAVKRKIASGVLFSGVPHPKRDCTYKEADICRSIGYISRIKMFRVWIYLMLNGLPRHAGLIEANLMLRKHNDVRVREFDELWWERVTNMCFRDQLSVMCCLKRAKLGMDFLLGEGHNTRNTEGLRYVPHK